MKIEKEESKLKLDWILKIFGTRWKRPNLKANICINRWVDIYAIARLDGGNHLQNTRHSAWKEMKCPAAFLHTHRWEQIFYKTVVFTDRLDIYVIVPLLHGADSLDNNFGRLWLLRHLIKTRLVWVQVREGWIIHEKP